MSCLIDWQPNPKSSSFSAGRFVYGAQNNGGILMKQFLQSTALVLFGLSVSFFSAPTDDQTDAQPPAPATDTLPAQLISDSPPSGFSALPSHPTANELTAEKVALGRKLFFDARLSKDSTVSCASCHRPDHGFANSETVAIGIDGRKGTRNVPTIFNRGFGKTFSWDGNAATLEAQVLTPITNENELGNTVEGVLTMLQQDDDYVRGFEQVFAGGAETGEQLITAENLGKAIAAFERTLIYAETKVDRFRAADYSALSKKARQGMWIFESKGGCWKCHNGENFTDEEFHNTGVGFGSDNRDVGRFTVTENDNDRFKFKTPTIRGIELTAPYMHDGSLATLKDVVDFYNRGGAVADQRLDAEMEPLDLTAEEVDFLVEFLKALSQ